MTTIPTFNFCGVDAVDDLDLIVNEIREPVTPEITESTQNVPGMVGEIFLGNSYGKKVFEIDITIKANDAMERTRKIHELTTLVMTFGSGEYPMIFSNDSAYIYYGHFTSVSKPERIIQNSSWAKCTLTFACSDPKGYGEYINNDITTNPLTIIPEGTGECYPVFTCLPKTDVKKIAVTDEDGTYVFVGADVDPDTGDSPIDLEPLVLSDNCNTLANWTKITQSTLTWNLENGVVSGEMRSTANALRPALDADGHQDFGPNHDGDWHGPVRLQWLPSSYDDFRIRVRLINNQTYSRANGKIEIYLLNSDGARIGKFMLKDTGTESKVVTAQVQLGGSSTVGNHKEIYAGPGSIRNGKKGTVTIKVKNGTKKVKEKGKTKTVQLWKTVKLDEDLDTSTFTNFYGWMELQKIGNKYRIEIVKLDDQGNPAWSKPIVKTWTDTKNLFTNNALAGVAVYCAKYDITEDRANPRKYYHENDLVLADLMVWNIINGGDGSSPKPKVIARNGDEIKINCEDRTVYKNGAVFMNNLYIGSSFPTMKGEIMKTFAFEPDFDEADWYLEYLPTTD